MALEPDEIIREAFDPETFREQGHRYIDRLADSLKDSIAGTAPVKSTQSPEEAYAYWSDRFQEPADSDQLLGEVLGCTFRCHHPHNMGHQVGPVLPAAALTDLAGSLLDTGNGVFEVGNPATPMERVVIQELAKRTGLPDESDGILTSGGSLGNLTALLAMRQVQSNTWDSGCNSRQKFTLLVSQEAHYCVERAVKIMGWGDSGIITVKVDAQYRMDLDALAAAYQKAKSNGQTILGVVGSAGSTATGKIDPLQEIGNFCRQNDLWFHVDAAHAGAFVFSRQAKTMLKGIEMADSVVIDFHKMLLSPSLLTVVLFRSAGQSYQTFAQKADYLWRENQTHEWWDAAKRTIECTRPMLGLRAYSLVHSGKEGLFECYIDRMLTLTHRFAEIISGSDDFEILVAPESNIICYRYRPDNTPADQLNQLNCKVRQMLVDSGQFYIVQVEKNGQTYLRSALMNPFISERELVSLLDFIRTKSK